MSDETPQLAPLDRYQATSARFRTMQADLLIRRKTVEALEAKLKAERINQEGQVLAVASMNTQFQRERDQISLARSTLKKDAAAVEGLRDVVAAEDGRLKQWARLLEDRERGLAEAERRLELQETDLAHRMDESKAKLQSLVEHEEHVVQREQALVETAAHVASMGQAIALRQKNLVDREEAFMRRQNERLASLEVRENEISAFRDAMSAILDDVTQQGEAYTALRAGLEPDVNRIVEAREWVVSEEERIEEGQATLARMFGGETAEFGADGAAAFPVVSVVPEPALPVPPELVPVAPEPVSAPAVLVEEKIPEPEATPPTTRAGAVARLAEAIQAWHRAREAGANVAGLRDPARSARNAIESGDYEGAIRFATTMLDRLQATRDTA